MSVANAFATSAKSESLWPSLSLLQAEWDRLHLLTFCLSSSRQGQSVAKEDLLRLETLQRRVELLRGKDGDWHRFLDIDLSLLEWDVFVCALAPSIDPRLGWLFQNLQVSQNAQPYPSFSLIHELLALEPAQGSLLRSALGGASLLVRSGLLQPPNQLDPYAPIVPAAGVVERILGTATEWAAPPGSVLVRNSATWDDLVLTDRSVSELQEFLLWVTHRNKVVDDWGGQTVGGPVALFNGPSGTGKTLAASVLANELGWPLFRVDLGRLVSKYIGETEQNLNNLFDAAHGQPMVLQFDEADALFAKRGDVKEARDRYANMEVSHLLARIEAHQGPCILTTNLRKQMDAAFTRRFQMVVEFPRPDLRCRALLWQRLLPPNAPKSDELNYESLARSVNLSGGSIRNAALHAAYLAASKNEPIGLSHLAQAVWRELAKEGREVQYQELGYLSAHLPEDLKHD